MYKKIQRNRRYQSHHSFEIVVRKDLLSRVINLRSNRRRSIRAARGIENYGCSIFIDPVSSISNWKSHSTTTNVRSFECLFACRPNKHRGEIEHEAWHSRLTISVDFERHRSRPNRSGRKSVYSVPWSGSCSLPCLSSIISPSSSGGRQRVVEVGCLARARAPTVLLIFAKISLNQLKFHTRSIYTFR